MSGLTWREHCPKPSSSTSPASTSMPSPRSLNRCWEQPAHDLIFCPCCCARLRETATNLTTNLHQLATLQQDRVLRVIGYVRVSTDMQAQEGVSLDAQRERIRCYC